MSANSDRRHLPEEIVIEILSRLSVKSLLRFMCVCKLWYILIKSPSFINKHFYQENNQCPLLVHRHKYRNNKYIFSLFPDVTFGCEAPIFEEPDYLQMPGFPLAITGPMNGVFCLCNGDGVALWNPATREFRPLPAPPHLDVPSHLTELWHSFGFGLDPLTNCYKVVWFRCCWDEETDSLYHHEFVPVYAQDSDSWRYLSLDVPSFTTVDEESFSNTYVNGSYYWLLKIGNPSELLVLSFDMGSDEFKKIQAPDDPNRRQSALALYNDSIALFFYEYGEIETIVDIWVMKQEEGCWVKHLTVGPLLQIRWPAGFWKNDQIFLENNTSDLVLYDPNTNMIHNLGIRKDEAAFACFRVCAYKESLVSIKEGNKDWELDKWSDIVHEFFREPSPNT